MARRETPSADVFARTVPMTVERHYFGEHKKASLSAVETTVDKAMLALTKRLVQMPETAAIRQRDTRFRLDMSGLAIPFRPGLWLVPIGVLERADRLAQDWERERQGPLLSAAKAAYPAQIDAMREPLGRLFNPLDYPPVERFAAAFWVEWRFVNFGVPDVLREIRADVFERERVKLEEAGRQARAMVDQHLAGTLLGLTDHLVGLLQPRANGRRPALRDGALDKLFAFLDSFSARNVTNFTQLQAVTRQLRATVQHVDVAALRSDEAVRARTAEAMVQAREAVSALVTEETRRSIRCRDDEDE